ncbi:MAG TPA: MBL fold metallo-hydrolase [Gemmatimonadaceae bacterium]|nr:MBL fold metallo-hydrolase [Gemmatimonadaceae bacterium]
MTFALTRPITHGVALIDDPGRAAISTTTGAWASMVYAARTDSGAIVIDLGWTGTERAVRGALYDIGASREDVARVFITHAHRDHVAGWRQVGGVPVVIGAGDIALLVGDRAPEGWVPRLSRRIRQPDLPARGDLDLVPVTRDTLFVLGADTVFAYPVPGHTPGSTAYVFRGILFVGDAMNWRPFTGWSGARPEMSDDVTESDRSLAALWRRLPPGSVRVVCTAHAKCRRVEPQP